MNVITPDPERVLQELSFDTHVQSAAQNALEDIQQGTAVDVAIEEWTVDTTQQIFKHLHEHAVSPATYVALAEALDNRVESSAALDDINNNEGWESFVSSVAYQFTFDAVEQALEQETGYDVYQALALDDRIDTVYSQAKSYPEYDTDTDAAFRQAIEDTINQLRSDVLEPATPTELANAFVLLQAEHDLDEAFCLEVVADQETWEEMITVSVRDALTEYLHRRVSNATGAEL